MQTIMKKISVALLAVTLCFGSGSGCAAVMSNLPAVIAAVTDGNLVVDTIEAFANAYFITHPNPEKQKEVSIAIARTKAALDAALRMVHGIEKINQAKVDEAFADFRVFYTDLVSLTAAIGVKTGGTKLLASPGGLTVPEPLALKLKVN